MDQDTVLLKEHVKQNFKYYKSQVLDPEKHMRLVQDISRIADMANIPSIYIYTSMITYCSQKEIEWVKAMRRHQDDGITGAVFVGKTPGLEDRMMAMAGCLIRNFVDARVYTVQGVIEKLRGNNLPECRVLLIPNFFLLKDSGGDIPSWHISSLLGMLYSRFSKGLFTIMYVQDMQRLGEAYGSAFKNHLESHFTEIKSS